jgi:peptidyl-prolyl cis-trans isomerase C
MYKKLISISILSAIFATSAAFAEDKVVATVNGTSITQTALDEITEMMKLSRRAAGELSSNELLDDLIITEVVRQEAAKAKLTDRDDVKQKIKDFTDRLILSVWSQDKLKTLKISDEELKAAYDKRMESQAKEEYKARHILLKTVEEAKAVIVELKKGTDFAELAKTKSTGPSSSKGGDLGWFAPSAMVAPFADVVEKMAKEAISETPVKTEFGYHVIKLEDKRPIKLPSFDTVKPQLQRVIEQKKMREYVQTLRTAADVKVLLNPAKPATPVITVAPAADVKTAAPTPIAAPAPATPTATPAADAKTTAPAPSAAPTPTAPAAATADAKTTAPAAPAPSTAPVPATTPTPAAPAPAQ